MRKKVQVQVYLGSFFGSFSARNKHCDVVSVEEDLLKLGDLLSVGSSLVFCHIFKHLNNEVQFQVAKNDPTILTNSSNPRRVPTISLSFLMMI